MNRMAQKTVIVTGAGSGMGASHARRLHAEGANVVLTDINVDRGRRNADALGERALFVAHDVSDEASWSNVISEAERVFGGVHGLVNNAGINLERSIDEFSVADYQRVVSINQLGVFLGMREVHQVMARSGGGRIVNVSSTSGLRGTVHGVAYCASKAAVMAMTRVAAVEFADDGILVNAICPGFIDTEMDAGIDADVLSHYVGMTPLKRRAQPDEVSSLVLYLLSDDNSFSTGAEFVIDGGLTKWY
ncbi:3alpha(or 20beta)-hydroxysteroid dehydrogenase [Plantibacter sp. VKM Ac-1784]|uniref:3alpha(Or 20beta)-hydroxysteroid dehydrogenase n=1 Tax=Plantibacter elymi (nom. nud.) TaxID=199708 RepID=A0ABY1RDT0_9MICO|nr:glucose 1-dehydrogenase [Plantibacter sp. VKM Ac-1784]SMQ71150.1 3alpha(or 20beta)-hydroxysteroid dehydrogenase [Plantibacter sp. VKM Ac-1784]